MVFRTAQKYSGAYRDSYNETSDSDMTRSYSTVFRLAGISNGVEKGDCNSQSIYRGIWSPGMDPNSIRSSWAHQNVIRFV